MLDAEKRIRVLSLIKSGQSPMFVDFDQEDVNEDITVDDVPSHIMPNHNDELQLQCIDELVLSDVDKATLYYVAGYAGDIG